MKTYIIAGMVGLVALLGSTAEAEGPTLQDEAETLQHLATSPTLTADEQAQLAEMARLAIAIDKRMAELNSTGTRADSDPEFLRLEAELLTLRDRRLTDINNKMLAIFRHRAKGVKPRARTVTLSGVNVRTTSRPRPMNTERTQIAYAALRQG